MNCRPYRGVAEVATIGGMVRQYQVVVDPDKTARIWGDAARSSNEAIQAGQPGDRRFRYRDG